MACDIVGLMVKTFTGNVRDEFGRERNARHSLLLDAVMEGRRRASNSRLLRLPAEILAAIVDYLYDDQQALASLALVNSDCRQLARCAQFAEITFDYSYPKRILSLYLAAEGMTDSLNIGSCVRRITYSSKSDHVADAHRDLYNAIFSANKDSYTIEERERLVSEANQYYVQMRKGLLYAIANTMPNLEAIVWEDSFSVDKDFLWTLFRSPAQHVKLDRVAIEDMSCLEQPLPVAAWPLRSLDMNISSADYSSDAMSEHTLATFHRKILQLCAPTLEALHWSALFFMFTDVSFGTDPILFPRLRLLQLSFVHFDASTFAQSFLTSPLRHLELHLLPNSIDQCMAALARCEPLEKLKSFVIPSLPLEKETCIDAARFLEQNTHIEKLYIHEEHQAADENAHLDRCIIPVLANNRFDNLRSLSLAWGGGKSDVPHVTRTSAAALAVIGTIVSLEQLYLCSGTSSGWRRQWLVDHAELRHHLRHLSKLKILAIVRDTYTNPLLEIPVERYYQHRYPTADDFIDSRARVGLAMPIDTDDQRAGSLPVDGDEDESESDDEEIWEKAHRNRMLTHAESYAVVLPSLEWIYCGQRPMAIERDPQNPAGPRKAVPLTTARDDCSTFLETTFGISSGND